MSYQVLARKWRPQAFSEVVGQQHVLTALANGLSLGRIHHAWLFSGTRGVGKTTIARLLAKGLNCESGITATPCGQCDNCREIEQGRFVDLIEIDAASRTKVEDTRDLLDNVQYAPARGRFKVYLIDEVHMLSRHSFNALLKTLEEPPAHVKFLLATTDPQKLPVTILSRCLQFHLKALEPEQIRQQLVHVLDQEKISVEPRALQLLARAADGSMRDALSLTDQAIAMGQGTISTQTVSVMLGTLDDEQPLALIEALVNADGQAMMSQLSAAASRGVTWDALLVDMLALFHRIAMTQLLPGGQSDESPNDARLSELARTLPPAELQLYYQTLLVGRKELAYAPDPRMGVEMTLLRALAFHPSQTITEPAAARPLMTPQAKPQPVATAEPTVAVPAPAPAVDAPSAPDVAAELPDSTSQLLKARRQLQQRGENKVKKSEPAAQSAQPVSPVLARLAAATERGQKRQSGVKEAAAAPAKKEAYRWKAQAKPQVTPEAVTTPKALRTALEHEKTPELTVQLAQEAQQRDDWARLIAQLNLPKLVEQLALNAWKEESAGEVCLHLRSSQRHLNSAAAQQTLSEALSQHAGCPLELKIVSDDNPAQKTPLEWRQTIYEEKLTQARQSIRADNHIQTLCRLFDADVDDESIRPV
ncbi:DNA polymerase III subunit gamma/tau [Erwinia sp. OLTSP20]|uniref:DNA polymerase III subunit gamma/tau n=1 Tax=unclassified Erwinia TaxID=2622719 RepID=UPI000C180EEF|nr:MULTISPECIES: DNA polymerase III subunit gamma/tau [unclassified Erwinia]PIJ50617.1 DNA polymerase III subunit gamma/tau [Erwinia sp. OAMSP11]PIJ72663.1 DNA polymerase III subunit gamma/tau [Erwinia sp. OLSSP12]PIJ83254.1 DNA polymerase III subunit gamma/tau [Erwinia sp. OLCASP19]PIJ85244.1 DNA polymerase III subunit gamma/tau [Erwinia sp. OLMTSP26]PIJ87247.1 DNA polymerase III subunit gamma/tau [Erwinia sp. OLMDSP33]